MKRKPKTNFKTEQQHLPEIEELRDEAGCQGTGFPVGSWTPAGLGSKICREHVETVREPLVVLASSLKVISANRSFYETFQVTRESQREYSL